MEDLWKVAFSITGIGGVSAFVLYALYKDWLAIPALAGLTKAQRFSLFKLFLVLTFLFALAGLGLAAFQTHAAAMPRETSREELEAVLLARAESAKLAFDEALRDPRVAGDSERMNRLRDLREKYDQNMREATEALRKGQLNLYHERANQLNELLYSQDFTELLPNVKPGTIANMPTDVKCDNCV